MQNSWCSDMVFVNPGGKRVEIKIQIQTKKKPFYFLVTIGKWCLGIWRRMDDD